MRCLGEHVDTDPLGRRAGLSTKCTSTNSKYLLEEWPCSKPWSAEHLEGSNVWVGAQRASGMQLSDVVGVEAMVRQLKTKLQQIVLGVRKGFHE